MRFDFVDAGKAALLGITCIGGIIGITELLAWIEERFRK